MMHKSFGVEVKRRDENGGRIIISTPGLDRDNDRIDPFAIRLENYQRNPIVLFGHKYNDPLSVVGRARDVSVSAAGLVADFELRPAANESDPQNVVRLLWAGDWLRTASIGFTPYKWTDNEHGGRDYTDIELIEFSLVPVPSQPSATALRMAAKALDGGDVDAVATAGAGGLSMLERDLLFDRLADLLDAVRSAFGLD